MVWHVAAAIGIGVLVLIWSAWAHSDPGESVFYPLERIEAAKANVAKYDWAKAAADAYVEAARPWMEASEDELWSLMPSHTITRSWMVWSDGYCPACNKDVRMYDWKMEPWEHRWKVQCPHCEARFPTNDFGAYYDSGLDDEGIFDPNLADRSLLYNVDHPDPSDPKHRWGVDDGEGYLADGNRWRFIGAYIIYGQWKRLVYGGVVTLSQAYLVTGDPEYAYRAGILLDRAADLFPHFHYQSQGLVYEKVKGHGQVSIWHDACSEITWLCLAYDRLATGFPAVEDRLVAFLSKKAAEHDIDASKDSLGAIIGNIEGRLFRFTAERRHLIESNRPNTDVALLYMNAILDWPNNRETLWEILDTIIETDTSIDGVSGEKGLVGYGSTAPRAIANLMAQMRMIEPGFLEKALERYPQLHETYRFHIDTWFDMEWYPLSGDTGRYARKHTYYAGATLPERALVFGSPYTFMWELYELTGDVDLVRVMYNGAKQDVGNLPMGLLESDVESLQRDVQAVIDEQGPEIDPPSTNKTEWHLAMLRSGEGKHKRAFWLDYDAHERHCHADGLNLGLFAKGLDLLPELGYPAVGFGGWESKIGKWYKRTAAHVTVEVDGQDHDRAAGTWSLWFDGAQTKAFRAEGAAMIRGERFERTVAMVDIDAEDVYLVDVFRVKGGTDHAFFMHSYWGTTETGGLDLEPAADYSDKDMLRNFRLDPAAQPGWTVTWNAEDRYDYLPADAEPVSLSYTGLTPGLSAGLCEAWYNESQYGQGEVAWLPWMMARRTVEKAPLETSFVGVIEPRDGASKIAAIKRLELEDANGKTLGDSHAAVQLEMTNGDTHLVVVPDHLALAENDAVRVPAYDLTFAGHLATVVLRGGEVRRMAIAQGRRLAVGDAELTAAKPADAEIVFEDAGVVLRHGKGEVVELRQDGNRVGLTEH